MVDERPRYIDTWTWALGLVGKDDWKLEKLPKLTCIKAIHLRLAGTITSTATAPTRVEDSPMSLVRQVTLRGNGASFRQLSGARLYYRNFFFYGIPLERRNVGVTASTEYAFQAHLILPMQINRYAEGYLPPVFSALDIAIQWGTYSDIYSAATPTSWTTTPTVELYVEEDDYRGQPKNVPLIKEWEKEDTIAASGPKDLDFPKGNTLLDAMMYIIDNSVRSDSLCTQFSVKSRNPNEDLVESVAWAMAQGIDKKRYSIDEPCLEADGSTHNYRTVKSFVMVDWTKIGGLPTAGREAVTFKGTMGSPTGTAKVGMLVRELLPAIG